MDLSVWSCESKSLFLYYSSDNSDEVLPVISPVVKESLNIRPVITTWDSCTGDQES